MSYYLSNYLSIYVSLIRGQIPQIESKRECIVLNREDDEHYANTSRGRNDFARLSCSPTKITEVFGVTSKTD